MLNLTLRLQTLLTFTFTEIIDKLLIRQRKIKVKIKNRSKLDSYMFSHFIANLIGPFLFLFLLHTFFCFCYIYNRVLPRTFDRMML